MRLFDPETGRYIRTSIMKNGKETGVDPFMASFPELLDVGIMGNCRHGQSGLCIKAGVRTNIHYVLNKSTVHEAVERLKAHGFPEGINAIVFLLHKPVGLGKKENIITAGHREFQRLLRLAVSGKTAY